jgi:hypothetical protein
MRGRALDTLQLDLVDEYFKPHAQVAMRGRALDTLQPKTASSIRNMAWRLQCVAER